MAIQDNELGSESFIGLHDGPAIVDSEASPGQAMRDRLALATMYLSNWYEAVKKSPNKDIWYKRIDTLRAHIETLYKTVSDPKYDLFVSPIINADYDAIGAEWAQLFRDIYTNSDDLIQHNLLTDSVDTLSAIVTSPLTVLPKLGNDIGAAIGGTIGGFVRQTFPWLIAAGAIGLVYVFREPIGKLINKMG